jgi:hypothetical protein
MARRRGKKSTPPAQRVTGYEAVLADVTALLESARRTSAKAVNVVITATYWQIGRRIVEYEQAGKRRAAYGEAIVARLADDLTARFGRGFSRRNLEQMRMFYLGWPIAQTPPAQSAGTVPALPPPAVEPEKAQTPSALFPLPWSHYARLLGVKNPHARTFYETEALRCGWTVKQLDRQINSLFYERTALSKNKTAMLAKAEQPKAEDRVTPEEEIKDPFVLEFLSGLP